MLQLERTTNTTTYYIMTRTIEKINTEISRVTEVTGETWLTQMERAIPDEGFCLFQGVAYPILTQHQIENTVLPHFDLDRYPDLPRDSDQLFGFLYYMHNLYSRSILERVARVRIAKNLELKSDKV